jgi:hypothetical protein
VLSLALAGVILILVAVAALLHASSRARARALGDEVRAQIEPYLRRKAAEVGLPATAPTWTARSEPEEMVSFAANLAKRLLARERAGGGDAADLEYARTQPAEAPRE